jgi:hypothetical protein
MAGSPAALIARGAALALALLLFAPALARADVVVHDGGVGRDREAASWVKSRTGRSPTRVLTPDVLTGPDRILLENATLERCEGSPVALDAGARLDLITDMVLSFDLEAALESLRVLDTLLPCIDKPVERRQLARLFFLRGAAHFDLGQEDAAGEAMLEAAATDPEYEGERGFPKAHSELLESMRTQSVSFERSTLFVWMPTGVQEIRVDGEVIAEIRKAGVSLPGGLHLVQVVDSEGISGMWIRVTGSTSTVVFPKSGRRLWADGGRSPGGARAMSLLLDEVFQGREGDVHLIHYRARTPMGATFGPAGREAWEESEPTRSRRDPRVAGDSDEDKAPGRTPRKERRRKPRPEPEDPPVEDEPEVETAEVTEPDEPADVPDETPADEPDEVVEPEVETPDEPSAEADEGGEAVAEATDTPDETPDEGGDEPSDPDVEPDEPTEPVTRGTTRKPRATADPSGPKRLRIAILGGYQYSHPFSYGTVGLDVGVWIWGPLQAGLFVRAGYAGQAGYTVRDGNEDVYLYGPVFFVPMGVSVGVRKNGWLSPFVNVAFQYAYNRDGLRAQPFLGGAVVQGGLDISPKDSPLVIRVEGEAGNLGRFFNVRIGAGAGVRF